MSHQKFWTVKNKLARCIVGAMAKLVTSVFILMKRKFQNNFLIGAPPGSGDAVNDSEWKNIKYIIFINIVLNMGVPRCDS